MKNRVAQFGIFTALALIFGYLETLIPFHIGIPGIKLGLSNLIIVIALYKLSLAETYALSVVKAVLTGFLFGNLFAILYSLAGGILSVSVMALVKKSGRFSVAGVSICGGVFHNVGQLAVAAFAVESYSVIYYMPVLLVAGCITGCVIGLVGSEMLKRLNVIEL